MKKLRFIYNMCLKFDSNVENHHFSLKCIPVDCATQKIYSLEYKIEPLENIDVTTDGFGNKIYIGHCLHPHNYFGFNISGIAWVDNNKEKKEILNRIFLYESQYTRFTAALRNFEKEIEFYDNDSDFKRAYRIMENVNDSIEYVTGATDINTTADEALKLRKGVCQDYAHVMIALCRLKKIPARYVAGLMIGEGATHAWVEIYHKGKWVGFDPTNNKIVDDYYIKLSQGRDYSDCVIDKGTFIGMTNQEMNVYVSVKEI